MIPVLGDEQEIRYGTAHRRTTGCEGTLPEPGRFARPLPGARDILDFANPLVATTGVPGFRGARHVVSGLLLASPG